MILPVLALLSVQELRATCTLTWLPNTEANVVGYRVYHALASGGYIKGQPILDIPLTETTCEQMQIAQDGLIHYWVVTAVNTAGLESGFSNEVSMQMLPAPGRLCLKFTPRGKCLRRSEV